MGLTSPTTQYLSIASAVLATFAVLLLWNRVRGPRVVRVLSRFGLLLGGYVATTIAVLVSVNIAYGGLIVSVDDLFADLNPPTYYHHAHTHRHRPIGATPSAASSPKPGGTPAASPE